MKDVFLVVTGVVLGMFGLYFVCCQEEVEPRVVDASVVEDKFKEIGDLVFGEKAMKSEADLRVEKAYYLFNKKVASDGAVIKSKWTGLHRYGINFKDNPISVQESDGKLIITVPPYAKRVSYIQGGNIDFKTINGSWVIKKDKRYEVAIKLLSDQNDQNGENYMMTDDGKEELLKSCVTSVSGIVYPLVRNEMKFDVICQHPAVGG